jgi:hypothetical protein
MSMAQIFGDDLFSFSQFHNSPISPELIFFVENPPVPFFSYFFPLLFFPFVQPWQVGKPYVK